MSENSYKSILKGTSIFGSVQIVQILINLARAKFVAMILGPEGIGISSLFTSSSNTLQRLSSLGLNLALVKEVATKSDKPHELSHTLAVARTLITATALFGAFLCMVMSPWLSCITFGNYDMQWQFVLLGTAVGLSIAFNGNLSILQGLHQLKSISRCSIAGGIAGLIAGIPLYYIYGIKGIVPAMVTAVFEMWIFSIYSLRKTGIGLKTGFSWRHHKPIVRKLTALGLLMMTNELILSLVQYAINIYVNYAGSTNDVGLYQAANSITAQYSGLVFTAMSMDFFPRLSKVADNDNEIRKLVNRQNEVVAMIITPAVTLLILTSPILIRLLLTQNFISITPLMRWMGLGILFRALMVPMGYISFAKGNKRIFFWLEGITLNVLTLLLSCGCFHFFGLAGLGYAFVADNLICLIIYYIVNRHLYCYRLSRDAKFNMVTAVILVTGTFASSLITSGTLSYTMMALISIIASAWAFLSLRRRLLT